MFTYIKDYIQDLNAVRVERRYKKMVTTMGKYDFRISDNPLFMRRLARARKAYLDLPRR